tara:strand:+ start:359 stop:541 length:183 start_codon:yes stop_codon:yes gene_type:complete
MTERGKKGSSSAAIISVGTWMESKVFHALCSWHSQAAARNTRMSIEAIWLKYGAKSSLEV